jgi:hypothetical protein
MTPHFYKNNFHPQDTDPDIHNPHFNQTLTYNQYTTTYSTVLCTSKISICLSEDAKTLPVPEIIDPVFAKTSQNARFLLSENERFGLVFVKTGSINSGSAIVSNIFKNRMLKRMDRRLWLQP